MAVSKARQKSNRKWNENNLDRLYVFVPKGQKEVIRAMAESKGESLNAYVSKAIQRQLEEDQK